MKRKESSALTYQTGFSCSLETVDAQSRDKNEATRGASASGDALGRKYTGDGNLGQRRPAPVTWWVWLLARAGDNIMNQRRFNLHPHHYYCFICKGRAPLASRTSSHVSPARRAFPSTPVRKQETAPAGCRTAPQR